MTNKKIGIVIAAILAILFIGITIPKLTVHDTISADADRSCIDSGIQSQRENSLLKRLLFATGAFQVTRAERGGGDAQFYTLFRIPIGGQMHTICDFAAPATGETTITPVTLVDGKNYNYPGTYHASPVANGLKSYTSERYSVSFNYSPDYVLFENTVEGGPQAQYNFVAGSIVMGLDLPVRQSIARAEAGYGGGAPSGIVLTFFLKSDQSVSLEQWLRSSPNGNFNPAVDPDAERTLMSATIAGVPALKYHSEMGMYPTDYAVFTFGNWFVQASSGNTEGSDARSDFETVLASLKVK